MAAPYPAKAVPCRSKAFRTIPHPQRKPRPERISCIRGGLPLSPRPVPFDVGRPRVRPRTQPLRFGSQAQTWDRRGQVTISVGFRGPKRAHAQVTPESPVLRGPWPGSPGSPRRGRSQPPWSAWGPQPQTNRRFPGRPLVPRKDLGQESPLPVPGYPELGDPARRRDEVPGVVAVPLPTAAWGALAISRSQVLGHHPAPSAPTGRVRILILSCLSSHPLEGLARVVRP